MSELRAILQRAREAPLRGDDDQKLTAAVETEHGQRAGDSIRLDLATGDLVLGAVPAPDESKTVEEV